MVPVEKNKAMSWRNHVEIQAVSKVVAQYGRWATWVVDRLSIGRSRASSSVTSLIWEYVEVRGRGMFFE